MGGHAGLKQTNSVHLHGLVLENSNNTSYIVYVVVMLVYT